MARPKPGNVTITANIRQEKVNFALQGTYSRACICWMSYLEIRATLPLIPIHINRTWNTRGMRIYKTHVQRRSSPGGAPTLATHL